LQWVIEVGVDKNITVVFPVPIMATISGQSAAADSQGRPDDI
jgi:hypothetical protein